MRFQKSLQVFRGRVRGSSAKTLHFLVGGSPASVHRDLVGLALPEVPVGQR